KLQYDSAADTGIVFDAVAASRQSSGDGFLPDVTTIRSPYTEEILEFAAAIRGETTARVSAADGAYAVQISRAALESIATGRSIACSPRLRPCRSRCLAARTPTPSATRASSRPAPTSAWSSPTPTATAT